MNKSSLAEPTDPMDRTGTGNNSVNLSEDADIDYVTYSNDDNPKSILTTGDQKCIIFGDADEGGASEFSTDVSAPVTIDRGDGKYKAILTTNDNNDVHRKSWYRW